VTNNEREINNKRGKSLIEQGFVSIYEFAARTGYSYRHVYEAVRLGKLGAVKGPGKRGKAGQWRIPAVVLQEALTVISRQERDGGAQ